jgi:hypothetical protein
MMEAEQGVDIPSKEAEEGIRTPEPLDVDEGLLDEPEPGPVVADDFDEDSPLDLMEDTP